MTLLVRHDLPWQNRPIYEIWISEIMLQQTQVKTVKLFFRKFIKKFPNLDRLIDADLDEILEMWSGLGYYRRAKNIYAACRVIEENYNSRFPTNFTDISKITRNRKNYSFSDCNFFKQWPLFNSRCKC